MSYDESASGDGPSLRALRYFVALAEDPHFSRTAMRLGIAQPSLSQQIKVLESKLGAQLFRRTKRTVGLTEAGHALLPDARRLMADAARMRNRVRAVASGAEGTLRVGFVASGAYDILPAIVRRFRAICPNALFELDECMLRFPVDQLLSGTLDLAIARGPFHHDVLRSETFLREPLCVALPAAHPLAKQPRVRLRDLAGEPFALFPRQRSPEFHDAIVDYCRAAGFEPRIAHEAAEWQMLASLVAAGLAVSLAPVSVRRMPRAGVKYCLLSPPRKLAQLDLVYGTAPPSPLVLAFVRAAREAALTSP